MLECPPRSREKQLCVPAPVAPLAVEIAHRDCSRTRLTARSGPIATPERMPAVAAPNLSTHSSALQIIMLRRPVIILVHGETVPAPWRDRAGSPTHRARCTRRRGAVGVYRDTARSAL